jgi:hypothetical protein
MEKDTSQSCSWPVLNCYTSWNSAWKNLVNQRANSTVPTTNMCFPSMLQEDSSTTSFNFSQLNPGYDSGGELNHVAAFRVF